jgi:UPF0271 protein
VIELSADLGEGSPREDEIWPLIDAANVACGGHVGDEASMREAVRLARRWGVVLGAHPSYPDREGFGRRSLTMPPAELRSSLAAQIGDLAAIAAEHEVRLVRVKPHGALYNDAHADTRLAAVIVEALRDCAMPLALVCAETSAMAEAARQSGIAVVREAFADRRYRDDGSLQPRTEAGSTLDERESAEQAQRLASRGEVIAAGGAVVRLRFDTICIHADLPGAVERLQSIRRALGA